MPNDANDAGPLGQHHIASSALLEAHFFFFRLCGVLTWGVWGVFLA